LSKSLAGWSGLFADEGKARCPATPALVLDSLQQGATDSLSPMGWMHHAHNLDIVAGGQGRDPDQHVIVLAVKEVRFARRRSCGPQEQGQVQPWFA
jgi:hypothetical protein